MKNLWKRIKVILLVLMYVAIYYGITFLVQAAYMLWRNISGRDTLSEIAISTTNNLYALGVIAVVITFWIYLFIGHIRKCPLYTVIENRNTPPIVSAMAVCLAVGARLLVTVYYHCSQDVELLKKSIDEASAITPELTGTGQLLIAMFFASLFAPMIEELLFRGIIMYELRKIMRPWAAIGLQAILFGAAHGVLFQSMFAVVVGVFLGVVYYKTKSLKTAVICHGAFNLSVVITLSELNFGTSILVAVLGIVLVTFSMIYIVRSSKE